MDALQTTHQTQTAIAAGVFLPLVQAALEDRAYDTWLRSCRFRPELYPRNTALEQRLLLGGRVTDAELPETLFACVAVNKPQEELAEFIFEDDA